MASNIQFGVKIDAGVTGKESVEQLTARLDEMAKLLEGELKQEAQAAAEQLRKLGEQQAAISAVEQLKREVTEAGAALKRAEKEAADFAAQLTKAGPPTAQEAAHLQRLEAAADKARTGLQGQQEALAGAVAGLQKHGIAATQTQVAQQRLNTELLEARARTEALAPAWQGSARAASAAGEQMQRTHRAIGDGVQSISTQLTRVQSAILALSGGSVMGGMIKDVVQTADAFSTLSARIKLVTGDGEAFEQALEGVQRVAIATRSDLEATGTLFTKVLTAGRELGLSQAQALALTETINQAIQITGGSADAAKAAITQLTQGLQSGTLRGDEFNSVMEQAPRLAQALAAGLGVGTGELRKMAEQGRLTSEAVITALRGQTDAVAAEFAKLPPTVSGALQNLSTAWTGFVGELNQGTGATQQLAEGLKFLADNLDTIASAALTLGQGAIAVGVLRVAQSFLGWATQARLAAVETAAATAATATATTATTANTAATTANTAATVANTAAKVTNAAASKGLTSAAGETAAAVGQASAAKTAATKSAGFLSAAWGSMAAAGRGLLSLIGGPAGLIVLTAAYAKEIGELAAKLVLKAQGLKTVEQAEADLKKQEQESLAQAERLKEARDRQIAADKAAAEAKFGLGKAASELVQKFEELIQKGKSTDEALGEIGKSFDLSKQAGIRDAAGVLDKLLATGKVTAEQFQASWATALDGRDLLQFEVTARAALDGTARASEQLAAALDAQLGAAVRRTGLDFDLIRGGMSKASVSVLNDIDTLIAGMDKLKAQGIDVATVLTTRLGQGLKTADSQQAVDELRARIESLRKVLGNKVTDGLLEQATQKARELKSALDAATPGINSVAEAMKVLGVTSQQSLNDTAKKFSESYELIRNSGTATARELQDAFIKYAQAAIAANGGVASEAIKLEAALRGVEVAADGTVRVMKKGFDEATASVRKTTQAVEDQITALERENAAIERANQARAKAADLERERLNVDKDGFVRDTQGNRQTMTVPTVRSVFEEAKRQGVDDSRALAIAKSFFASDGTPVNFQHAGSLELAVQKAIDQAVLSRAQQGGRPGNPNTGATPVIINLRSGYSQTVNVASAADANALRQLLQKLEQEQGRSGP